MGVHADRSGTLRLTKKIKNRQIEGSEEVENFLSDGSGRDDERANPRDEHSETAHTHQSQGEKRSC